MNGILFGIFLVAVCVIFPFTDDDDGQEASFLKIFPFSSTPSSSAIDYHVDSKCAKLPTIRPSGAFFLDKKVKKALSPDSVSPRFYIGSTFGNKVRDHMTTDTVHFKLIKELLSSSSSTTSSLTSSKLAFDLGANQGFFTYYLAALGMDVHSFEISEKNFISLQHGQYYNNKDISDRVNLYPVGMDNKVSRFDMSGSNYDAFLNEKNKGDGGDGDGDGTILGVSFDCFAHHSKIDLSRVAFLKIDVEGFEIAALMGASNSLFNGNSHKIGGMLMEVGPDRWSRANIDLDTGINEMVKVAANNFKHSYILIRSAGGHMETCPVSLVEGVLSDDKPEIIDGKVQVVHKHRVKLNEWKPLLTKMEKNHFDCNFWYTN